MREAAEDTGWRDPDPAFEQRVHQVVDLAYDDEQLHAELDRLIRLVDAPGWSNSLAGKLIQLTMPGVPDVYQGTELYDYSLVDPDNRRQVDFELRRRMLSELDKPALDGTGAAKLWLVRQALTARREHPELLTGYRPLQAGGPAARHVVAFDRGGLSTVATRLPVTLAEAGGWRGTELALPAGEQLDLLTGTVHRGRVPLAELFARYPVALLRSA
jgi:(1->4)-alpha-D-glucan 1-alpha-D-glucosylmutase